METTKKQMIEALEQFADDDLIFVAVLAKGKPTICCDIVEFRNNGGGLQIDVSLDDE